MKKSVSQTGNALFLILMAVALFAALSYAVTQSGRDSGGISKEKVMLKAAEIAEYCALLESVTMRMILTGTDEGDLEYCSSGAGAIICEIDSDDVCTSGSDCAFSTDGGGAPSKNIVSEAGESGGNATAYYGAAFVVGVGDTDTGTGDSVCFFNDVSEDVCEELNSNLGISGAIPEDSNSAGINLFTIDSATGEYSFCHDADSTGSTSYQYVNVLYAR